jgi:hypothetical protein
VTLNGACVSPYEEDENGRERVALTPGPPERGQKHRDVIMHASKCLDEYWSIA